MAADLGFEALHPRVKAGEKGAGRFIDVLGKLNDFKAHFDSDRGVWLVPNERRAEFDSILAQVGWQAKVVRPGMREATDEERLRLKIPPAWTDVLIADDPALAGEWLATGVDAKGDDQLWLTTRHNIKSANEKYAHIQAMDAHIDELDQAISQDAMDNPAAAVNMVMRKMGLRVGNVKNTKALGATTLRRENVSVSGDKVRLRFTGKHGVKQDLPLEDAELAKVLRHHMRGKKGSDRLFDTNERAVARWLNGALPGATPRNLRTYLGTGIAAKTIADMPTPASQEEYRRLRNAVGDAVSSVLGNKREQSLESYIDPAVFAKWEAADNITAIHPLQKARPAIVPTAAQDALLSKGVLPERGELYFNLDPEGLHDKYGPVEVKEVSLAQITPVRARPEGIANAKPLMAKAGRGEGSKRDPITLVAKPDGTYKVYDGNSTYAIASGEGWDKIPAVIARNDRHAATIERVAKRNKAVAKARKAAQNDPNIDLPDPGLRVHEDRQLLVNASLAGMEVDGHPDPAVQSFDTREEMFAAAHVIHPEFDSLVTSMAGGRSVNFDEAVSQTGPGSRFEGVAALVAPPKEMSVAIKKIEDKYKGDHNHLKDVVRGTVLVGNLGDVPSAYEQIKARAEARGWHVREFENKYLGPPPPWHKGPTGPGYRDIKVQLVAPNGVPCELQIQTAPMFWAKEGGEGHDLYREIRQLDRQAELSPAQIVRLRKLEQKSRELYRKAWAESYGSL